MDVNDDRMNDGGASAGACDLCHAAEGNSPAHAAHVSGTGTYGKAFACEECHPMPSGTNGGTHENTVIDVVFPEGGMASARGAQPAWDGVRCTGVYCHGATMGGGTYTEPLWQDESLPDGVQCGNCHAVPPPSPHPQEDEESCSECHEGAISGGSPNPDTHIDGVVQGGGDDKALGAQP
jgi:predicted CxxxxCH...CXXCH cytochrome family protein